MAIEYRQWVRDEAWRFVSPHWVHARTADGKELVTLTGAVIVDFKGTGGDWRLERLNLQLVFPSDFFPPKKHLRIEHWAPFVTINAISNDHHAVNAGWAVNEFGGPGAVDVHGVIKLWADIAVRDVDGWLVRVGYSLTVSGVYVDEPPSPD